MNLDQKQFAGPVFRLGLFAQIRKQANHYRWKEFRMVSHL
jgi:hypothetical protein